MSQFETVTTVYDLLKFSKTYIPVIPITYALFYAQAAMASILDAITITFWYIIIGYNNNIIQND